MKINRPLPLICRVSGAALPALGACFALALSASAQQTFYFTNATTTVLTNWSQAGGWLYGSQPQPGGGSDHTIVLYPPNASPSMYVDNGTLANGGFILNSLVLSNQSSANIGFTLSGSNLVFQPLNGVAPTLVGAFPGTANGCGFTINNNVTLAGNLTISGNNGGGGRKINGVISGTGDITNASSTTSASGFLSLGSAANTFQGNWVLNGAGMQFPTTDASFGSPNNGFVLLNNGQLQFGGAISLAGTRSVTISDAGGILSGQAGGRSLTLTNTTQLVGAALNPLTIGGNGNLILKTNQDLFFGPVLVNGGVGSHPNNTATLTLSASNTLPNAASITTTNRGAVALNHAYGAGTLTLTNLTGGQTIFGTGVIPVASGGTGLYLDDLAAVSGTDAQLNALLSGGNLTIPAGATPIIIHQTANGTGIPSGVSQNTLVYGLNANTTTNSMSIGDAAGTQWKGLGVGPGVSYGLGSASGQITLSGNAELDALFGGTLTISNQLVGGDPANTLALRGTGTVVLGNDNTATSATMINPGATLTLGSGGATGNLAGQITDNGTLNVNRAGSATIGTQLAGSALGSVYVNGNYAYTVNLAAGNNSFGTLKNASTTGTMVFNGTNSYNTVNAIGYNIAKGWALGFNGGSWTVGSLGVNSTGGQNGGTFNIGGGAICTINNSRYGGHGTFNVGGAAGAGTLNWANIGGNPSSENGPNLGFNQTAGNQGVITMANSLGMSLNQGNTTAVTNSLTVLSGATVSVTNNLTLGGTVAMGSGGSETNTLTLAGGKLVVTGTLSANKPLASVTNRFSWTGGQLSAGAINITNLGGVLVNSAGTFAPGDLGTAGKTTITGIYSNSTAATALAIDINGLAQASAFAYAAPGYYDFVSVSSNAFLDGALNVTVDPNGYNPVPTDKFTILQAAAGGLSGSFTNLDANGYVYTVSPPGAAFQVINNGTTLVLSNYTPLVAGFTAAPLYALTNQPVAFTDNSSGYNAARSWNFGDGSPVLNDVTSVTHAYSAPGTYTVTRTVTAANGVTTSATATITIVNSFRQVVWAGDGVNNSWDEYSQNWTSGGSPTSFMAHDSVLFNDIGSDTPAISLNGSLEPSVATFSSSTRNYTLGGYGKLTGSASLKVTSGKVTVLTANDYAGGTAISSGANVVVGDPTSYNNSSLGSGKISVNGALTYNLALPGTVANVIDGAGSLTNAGPGALSLTGANTYSGGTVVAAGSQLNINSSGDAAHSPIGTGTLILQGGTIDNTSGAAQTLQTANPQQWNADVSFAGSSSLALGNGPVTLADDRWVTVNAQTLTLGGPISGSHALTKAGPGILALAGTNAYSGLTTVINGTLQIGAGGASGSVPGNITLTGGNLSLSRSDSSAPAGPISSTLPTSCITNLSTSAGNTTTLTLADGINTFGSIGNRTPGTLVLNASANSTNYLDGTDGGLGLSATNSTSSLIVNGGTYVVRNQLLFGFLSPGYSYGTLSLNGGTLIASYVFGGDQGGASFTRCNLSVNNNATFHVTTGGLGLNVIGNRPGTQSFTVTGGQVLLDDSDSPGSFRGMHLANYGGLGTADNYTGNFSGTQTGGSVTLAASVNNNVLLGNSATNRTASYLLSGGSLTLQNGGNLALGATNGTGSATFTLSGTGKLSVSGSISGYQPDPATQVFAFQGGSLVAGTVDMTNLRDAAADPVGTLVNAGGALSPGDTNTPGQTLITGNYACSNSAALAIDLNGPTPANAFTNSGAYYDNVSVSGTAALNGSLLVYTNGITPTPTDRFTILSAGAVTGSFNNLLAGSRVPVANSSGASFQVVNDGTRVVLTDFAVSSAPVRTNITYTVSGGSLVLTWPNGAGWILEAQTNGLRVGISNNWVRLPGVTSPVTNAINPANGAVFYRLTQP